VREFGVSLGRRGREEGHFVLVIHFYCMCFAQETHGKCDLMIMIMSNEAASVLG